VHAPPARPTEFGTPGNTGNGAVIATARVSTAGGRTSSPPRRGAPPVLARRRADAARNGADATAPASPPRPTAAAATADATAQSHMRWPMLQS
jgi:hypothetical protein